MSSTTVHESTAKPPSRWRGLRATKGAVKHYEHLLGIVTDAEIAARFGVSLRSVANARWGRAIPPAAGGRNVPKRPKTTLAERFWAKVDKDGPIVPGMDSPCWMWTAFKDHRGYGRIGVGGVTQAAHRVALRLDGVDVPSGMEACHVCDNPGCVRPDHLFMGTRTDNVRDMMAKGRAGFQKDGFGAHCRGARNHNAKLDAARVAEIRACHQSGESFRAIARRLGVNRTTVRSAVKGKTWREVA